ARDDRLAEADGEPVDADAEQTRDGEVAQLVDGDDQGQDQQERDDVSQGLAYEAQHAVLRLSTAQAARARCATTVVATRRASASTSRAISQATPAPLAAAPEPILARVSDATMAISRKPIRRSRKAWTPTSLAALNTAGLQPPACRAPRASSRAGNRSGSMASKVSWAWAARSSLGAGHGSRSGQARA